MPGLELGPERAVEHAGPGLKQEMCPRFRPAHLLLLREALSHDRVDRGFDERVRDPLPVSLALGVVRRVPPISGSILSRVGVVPPRQAAESMQDSDGLCSPCPT